MSINISADEIESEIRMTQGQWGQVLLLAYRHGWRPLGTFGLEQDERCAKRSMVYTANFLRVTADDAANIGAALKRAMATDPTTWDTTLMADVEDAPFVREWMGEIIAVCESGGFIID